MRFDQARFDDPGTSRWADTWALMRVAAVVQDLHVDLTRSMWNTPPFDRPTTRDILIQAGALHPADAPRLLLPLVGFAGGLPSKDNT